MTENKQERKTAEEILSEISQAKIKYESYTEMIVMAMKDYARQEINLAIIEKKDSLVFAEKVVKAHVKSLLEIEEKDLRIKALEEENESLKAKQPFYGMMKRDIESGELTPIVRCLNYKDNDGLMKRADVVIDGKGYIRDATKSITKRKF